MSTTAYLRGQPVYVVKRFFDRDPITDEGPLADPDAVTFEVIDPNDETASYVWGVAPQVTNPSVGVFLLSLAPPDPVGAYKWRCSSSGTGIIDAEEGAFDVIESGVLDPDPPKTAVTGPCSSWINGDDVAAAGPPIDGIGTDTYLLDDVAYAASSLLWSLTARQFPGVCEILSRPCGDTCGGWDVASGVPASWWLTATWYPGFQGWGWYNDCGDLCGQCGYTSRVNLAGYPVREILEVKISGVPLLEFDPDTGARNWRLVGRRWLERMWQPDGTSPNPAAWPVCQLMALDDDQPGTFSVRYSWGSDVPVLGRMAAAQLARELWAAQTTGKCKLPNKVTKATRQGVTIERIVPIASLLREGATGLALVDSFIADVNPQGAKMRSAVWSPDRQQFSRRVEQ